MGPRCRFKRRTHQQLGPWKGHDMRPPETLSMTQESMHDKILEGLVLNSYHVVQDAGKEVVRRNGNSSRSGWTSMSVASILRQYKLTNAFKLPPVCRSTCRSTSVPLSQLNASFPSSKLSLVLSRSQNIGRSTVPAGNDCRYPNQCDDSPASLLGMGRHGRSHFSLRSHFNV